MKKIISGLRKALEAYSPLAMAILIIPFFLPVDHQTHRRLLLLFCAFPGMLLTLLNPKAVFKNPILLLMILFVAYFTLQDVRGSLPITPGLIRQEILRAVMIIFPAITLSFSTLQRKLYPPAIWLILLASVIGSIYSLLLFYSENQFPFARFELATGGEEKHPAPSAMRCGFAAVLAGAFFLQSGTRLKRTDWFALACLPALLAATFYTHNRSGVLALLAAMLISLPGIKKRNKKTTLLFATVTASVLFYFASLHSVAVKPVMSPQQLKIEQPLTRFPLRTDGFAVTGEAGKASITDRLNIWRDLLSRMNRAEIWIAGHGLGRNNFVSEVLPEVQYSHYKGPDGFQLSTHSGYFWALYFGGLIGLGMLLSLLGTSGLTALHAGYAGYVPGALLIFVATFMLVDTQRLLTGMSGSEYLIFWVPLGLAAGLSGKQTA